VGLCVHIWSSSARTKIYRFCHHQNVYCLTIQGIVAFKSYNLSHYFSTLFLKYSCSSSAYSIYGLQHRNSSTVCLAACVIISRGFIFNLTTHYTRYHSCNTCNACNRVYICATCLYVIEHLMFISSLFVVTAKFPQAVIKSNLYLTHSPPEHTM
jgi:hypothetical protein